MLDTELVEHADDDLAYVVPAVRVLRDRADQRFEPGRGQAFVERGQCRCQLRQLSLEREPSNDRVSLERVADAFEHGDRAVAVAACEQDPRQRHGGVSAPGLELERAAQRGFVVRRRQHVGLAREQPVEEALNFGRGLYADELVDDAAVLERLDGRNALDLEGGSQSLVAVGVQLGEHDLAVARLRGALERGCQLLARPAPFGPEVDDDGSRLRALQHLDLECCLADVDDHEGQGRQDYGRVLKIDDSGGGRAGASPVVLLHGLTATRHYVVMGSRALERDGHRVLAYDARGHGQSDPGDRYDYAALADDLLAVFDRHGIERAVLAGASMGAHTAARFAIHHPDRVAGLVAITPAFVPDGEPDLARWDRLAAGLRDGGVEGFVEAYGDPGVPAAWRETVTTVLRQRMSRHEHPEAVADALEQTPRSQPFSADDELASISAPTLVVADRDEIDPGHPLAVGERWAQLLGAELIVEEPGKSPIAWSGSRLSRLIAAIAERDG